MPSGHRSSAIREERLSVVECARSDRGYMPAGNTAPLETIANRGGEIESPVDRADGIKCVAELRKDFFTDLVATRADVGADVRIQVHRRATGMRGEHVRGGARESGEGTAPSRMDDADSTTHPSAGNEHYRHTIRIEHKQRDAYRAREKSVARTDRRHSPAERARARILFGDHRYAVSVHLLGGNQVFAPICQSECGHQPCPVLVDRFRVITNVSSEIERVKGCGTHSSASFRERDDQPLSGQEGICPDRDAARVGTSLERGCERYDVFISCH